MSRYDIAIIGTGPGGLEAAITATVRNKSVLLVGSPASSEKVYKAHTIQNYLGLPEAGGETLQKAFLGHLDQMGIKITEDRIIAVYNMGDYFGLQGRENVYEAETVILATGVVASKPFPGEEEFLGRGVSYCATCDAALYRGKKTVVIGFSPKEEEEADFMNEYAAETIYIPMYKGDVKVRDGVQVMRVKPKSIEGAFKVTKLVTGEGDIETDGVFILRDAIAPGMLIQGLETDGPHVKVDLQMRTSMDGVYACGDIAGTPYQYIKAAGQGNTAALSAVSYLAEKARRH
ncbi:MAG: NAD(P)/FAD-dependent oxidoreductase [Solobacterium sp.]|nr:NAD(P)/FAD-dependent oxidoreductase [Solobacterium sp.]